MAELKLYFDGDPALDAGTLERELQQGLEQLAAVESAKTEAPPVSRVTGLEILAAVTLAGQILHQARAAGDDATGLVNGLKELFEGMAALAKTLKGKIHIAIGLNKKPIDALTDDDYQRIAAKVAALLQAKSGQS